METKERTTDSRGHVKWSRDDRNQLLEEYSKSGQTKKAYCRERGINLGTFYGWTKGSAGKGKKAGESKPTFKEISIPATVGHPVEIILPGEVRVCLRSTGSREELIELIRGIVAC